MSTAYNKTTGGTPGFGNSETGQAQDWVPDLKAFGWSRVMLSSTLAAVAAHCGGATAPANTAITPAQHAALYFDITTPEHNLDCNVCHGSFNTFQQYSCVGCHQHDNPTMDAAHIGITAAYTYSPTSCYQCHYLGTNLSFYHETIFPIAAGQVHQNIECVQCHLDPNNRANLDCLTCHPSDPTDGDHADAGVGGYVYASANCAACHPASQVEQVGAHTFTLEPGAPHYLMPCNNCHSNIADAGWVPPVQPIDFTTAVCTNCHPNAQDTDFTQDHSDIPNFDPTDNTSCIQSGCHQMGTLTASRFQPPPTAISSPTSIGQLVEGFLR